MSKSDKDTRLLEQLLDKYKFTRPVPDEIKKEILDSRKKNLVRVLKTVGAFSALYGVLLAIYFALKKIGAGIPLVKIVLSGITAAAVTYGGYYAVTALTTARGLELATTYVEKQMQKEAVSDQGRWVDQITLYNGRVIEGAILSRGAQYQVRTASGIILVPRNRIKMVKPLKVEPDAKGGSERP